MARQRKIATRATEIAAVQARHNEDQVLAQGALRGERRAAIARFAMISMFGLVTQTTVASRSSIGFAIGALYTIFAIVTVIITHVIKTATPRGSFRRPLILTLVDYTAIAAFAVLDIHASDEFHLPRMVIASAIILTFAVARMRLLHVLWSTLLCQLALWGAALYGDKVSLDVAFASGGLLVMSFMVGITNVAVRTMFTELRHRDNLTRFLPPQVVERVMRAGVDELAPIQREVSVLFSDIRGFTGLSETLEPRALLAMLDDYFGRMGQIVKGHDGVIGKFIGDGLLAYWNVPDTLDGHAAKAVAAARDMQRAIVELNREREQDGLAPIKIGIGIHTGVVAAGMMGLASQSEYTVIGDAVNVASRIEGLTKEHAAGVLISETTWNQLPEPRAGRRIDGAEIRGRKEPIALYALDQLEPAPGDSKS
jgi:adenylate cyclase